jgi:hypothetical protein
MPTPTLCQTFRKEAGAVWRRMDKARTVGMSLSEETLTECALYNVALAHQGTKIIIHLATKPEEKKHGADWEWWLVRGGRGFGFRVQAKRLFPNGRYQSLCKSGYQQLDTLVSASKNAGLVPLYCFFNFAITLDQFSGFKNSCSHAYHGPSFWGCALAFPANVKKAQSNELTKLSSIISPWHFLVCESDKTDLLRAAAAFLRKAGMSGEQATPRVLPARVTRLIEMGGQEGKEEYRMYLDDEYWSSTGDTPDEHISGIVVLRDLRDLQPS